jgi:hypothetical protein
MPAPGSTAGQVILRFSFAAEFVPIGDLCRISAWPQLSAAAT